MSCAYFSECRRKCHAVYGKLGEDCLAEELQEKRCLSIRHCPTEALKYYGATMEGLPKALCSSWAEAFAFGGGGGEGENNNEQLLLRYGEDFVEHHLKAQRHVNAKSNAHLKRDCRQIARDLARCLQSANITRR